MVQPPLLAPRTPGTAEASDRNLYLLLITRGAAANGSQDTAEIVRLADLLGLVTASDLASAPTTDETLYYDGTTLAFAKVNLARLGSDVTGRLVPVTSQGQAGAALMVNQAGAAAFSALPDASSTLSGVVELATAPEFATGSDRARVASVRVIREFYDLRVMPSGGTTGQVIKKLSDNDYDVGWANDAEGTGGGDATNLSLGARNATSLVIESSTGNNVTIPQATTLLAGLFSATDKDKLDTLTAARQMPAGGRDGQILAKSADTDYATEWIDASTGGGLTQEQVQDFVGAMVSGNTETGIQVTYDDANNKFNFVVPIQRSLEQLQDAIAAMFTGNTGVIFTYDDAGGTLTLAIPEATTTAAGLLSNANLIKLNSLAANRQLPAGGTARQVLTKQDSVDYNAAWETLPQSGGSTTLSGTIASAVDNPTSADAIIAEPSAAATWSDWTDVATYTASAAGRHFVTAQVAGKAEKTTDNVAWADMIAANNGDRFFAGVRLLHQTADDIGGEYAYLRNMPPALMLDSGELLAMLTTQITLESGDTVKIQARYQQQLIGTQGNVGDPGYRTAARLRFIAGEVILHVTNFGEIHPSNTPPPAHQVYILVRDTAAVPTIAEFKAGISSTAGSARITGTYANTQDNRYINIWSEDELAYISLSNVGLTPGENQFDDYTEGRLLDGATNGYTYTGYDIYERALRNNPTLSWRT